EEDLLVADFEGADYGDWKTEGTAFGPGPARGTLPNQMPVTGFRGKGLVNSYWGGDGSTGTLTSPPLRIQRPWISFLIGGGLYPGETCINLLVDGRVVRTATGPNDRPGGSERLAWRSWNIMDLQGKEAVIQIVDSRRGGWGHVNIDHILQTSASLEEVPRTMQLTLTKRYLNLPVKTGADKRRVRLEVAGRTVREFEIELAVSDPDFWVFLDVSAFKGQQAVLHLGLTDQELGALELLSQDDTLRGAENLYREKLRPQFHFSTRRGWNNDPNGLVYYKGEYHLFYQHNPYGWGWGNMHWGHAVSPDLVHWEELPIALYPREFGDWAFSGSAVVDRQNTGGFQTGSEKAIVAAYTSTGRGQCIAYSNDCGRTFTDYKGNPVVTNKGRDPKVLWHEPTHSWIMAVYDEQGESKGIAFYTSSDLKTWTFASRVDGYYECPEFFPLAVDGNPANTPWVLYAADGAYALGDFDGKTFTMRSGKHRFNYGNGFYASQTFSDLPAEDGRRIQIAWGRMASPGMPFNQMMDFPVELTLHTTPEGVRMFANPVAEIAGIHGRKHDFTGLELADEEKPLPGLQGDLFHVDLQITLEECKQVGLRIRGVPLVYDVQTRELKCGDCTAHAEPVGDMLLLEILVDRTSLEIFAQGGSVYMPVAVIPAEDAQGISVTATGGRAVCTTLEVFELTSIWPDPAGL
ncbi:MAG: GH32 C-terminal domain-containing protein, partial [Armatimonadia bacterium]